MVMPADVVLVEEAAADEEELALEALPATMIPTDAAPPASTARATHFRR